LAGETIVGRKKEKKLNKLIKRTKTSSQGKADIWKRIGYIPSKKSTHEMHQSDYRMRYDAPEGKGTHRSEGSNKRLKELCGF